MWHSYPEDARPFARSLATRVIRDRIGRPDVTPREVFGTSIFAREERVGEDNDVYSRNSEIWHSMVELAIRDASFRTFLIDQGLNPQDPVSDNIHKRDECLRKIKPIVLLRETYKGVKRGRSRKRPALYAGEEAIYAMSEGNPRLLAGLINELFDLLSPAELSRPVPHLPRSVQARVLTSASKRMRAGITAYPTQTPASKGHLSELLDTIGGYLYHQLVGPEFLIDPIGSFVVDKDVDADLLSEISRGLLIGAFIAVGGPSEVPTEVRGVRLRLSYMLTPNYKILFRNYRQVRLSTILRFGSTRQRSMFTPEEAV
jgi:hypothetical protein